MNKEESKIVREISHHDNESMPSIICCNCADEVTKKKRNENTPNNSYLLKSTAFMKRNEEGNFLTEIFSYENCICISNVELNNT